MADRTVDDILHDFAKRVEQVPKGKTYGWSDEKQALKSLFEMMMAEVVGADDRRPDDKVRWSVSFGIGIKNKLRLRQRQRIPRVIERYFGEDK